MPDTAADWFATLTDSVSALGAAARELRAAHHSARHAAWTTDPARLVPVPGLLAVPGAEPVRPHDEALWALSDLYMVLEHHTKELYENAALGYAYGTADAVCAVLRSDCPRHVELSRDRNGAYILPADGLPDLSASLSTAAGGPDLATLRDRVQAQEAAARTDVADEDADVLSEFSTALAEAAHAYGEQAERALHHLLRYADAHGFLRENAR